MSSPLLSSLQGFSSGRLVRQQAHLGPRPWSSSASSSPASFVLTAWPSCRGQRQPAASESAVVPPPRERSLTSNDLPTLPRRTASCHHPRILRPLHALRRVPSSADPRATTTAPHPLASSGSALPLETGSKFPLGPTQADTEQADIERERKELATDNKHEHEELAAIYVKRGLDDSLAKQVAEQLMAHDALATHTRDELGISETLSARPVQAALASAGTFAVGAAMPILTVLVTPGAALIPVVVVTSILFLALLGGFGAYAGGAPLMKSALRVTFWGALAMALTAVVGALFGATV